MRPFRISPLVVLPTTRTVGGASGTARAAGGSGVGVTGVTGVIHRCDRRQAARATAAPAGSRHSHGPARLRRRGIDVAGQIDRPRGEGVGPLAEAGVEDRR